MSTTNKPKLEWQYSRNQLRHSVRSNSELFEYKGHYYELFEIRSNRPQFLIRKPTDTHNLLHKGKFVAEHRSVKVLKEMAEKISQR